MNNFKKNQLALTEGLDKNRLAITQGFDKMDEIKKWDLQQLPGYEANEEPEIIQDILPQGKEDEEDGDEEYEDVTVTLPPREESKKQVVTYNDSDLDKGLVNAEADRILKNFKLPLPSEIKNEKYEVIKRILRDAESNLNFKKKLVNKANFKTKDGINTGYPKNENPRADTQSEIRHYNVMGIYVNNMSKLEDYAKKTGQGILHFNNPYQLLDRLELLGGSILAGNNGVIQEFSQIAHLLNQMKVITKKQLNDLLKKYILNK